MPPVLILLALLLPLGAGAEEILGSHEFKPHSCPYMAFIKSEESDGNVSYCEGFLIPDNFVLTAAHCNDSSMTVTLGTHNLKAKEATQQIIPVAEAIPYPDYNGTVFSSDIILLKLKSKAKRTRAVRPLNLPRRNVNGKPGDVCSIAGWGQMVPNGSLANILHEVELTVQKDWITEMTFVQVYIMRDARMQKHNSEAQMNVNQGGC
ncbi:granzyme E-like [Mus pahari]|uniref:granzyme E-like n=1 Tax=Mus pahari TaxID=10093 RepID=UPI000A30FA9F|nr:granzyme E-like [Mus pahari]